MELHMSITLWFQHPSLRSLTQEFSKLLNQKDHSNILKAGTPSNFPLPANYQGQGIWIIQGNEPLADLKKSIEILKNIPFVVISISDNYKTTQTLIENGALEVFNQFALSKIVHSLSKSQNSKDDFKKTPQFSNLLFTSTSPMKKIAEFLYPLAQRPSNVFIHGESGVGKEILAQTIHTNSKFSEENFIAINCGAINSQLIDSELFGHVKGAFTGAEKDSIGKIRQAQNGTLFLDEIGELPLVAQTRLLRVLQERKVNPVGSTQEIPVKFRLICATHRNLEEMIEEGSFREDLFYRICVFKIEIPNLDHRNMDIPLIAQHLWQQLLKSDSELKLKLGPLSTDELLLLQNHSWKGNIRELKNTLEQFTLYKDLGQSLNQLLKPIFSQSQTIPASKKNTLELKNEFEENERIQIFKTLEKTGWNKSKTARELGLSRNTLLRRLEFYTN
jgi:two-component system, NtrC family, response regulator PilR